MKQLLLAFIFISPLSAMELVESKAVSSKDALKLYTNQKDFYVEDELAAYRVEKHDMNKELRALIQYTALTKFKEEAGYIRIDKHDEGKYSLLAKVRGKGGGPICAWWAYGIAKSTMYSTAAAAATATVAGAVIATGGGVVPAAIAGTAVGKTVVAAAGVSTAANIVGGAAGAGIVAAAGVANTGLAMGGLAASAGSSAGIIAMVEAGSIGFAALFAGPWCP